MTALGIGSPGCLAEAVGLHPSHQNWGSEWKIPILAHGGDKGYPGLQLLVQP